MIPDKLFKSLRHSFKGFQNHLNGQNLESGYKPDFVLKRNDEYIIIESENSSSRKMFVGGLMKAAHFLRNQNIGILVFVIVPKENTTASAIAKHLKVYLEWIKNNTNLRDVFVIDDSHYYSSEKILSLDGKDFRKCAFKV